MSKMLTIHKEKNHMADALWWKPFFNMQHDWSQNWLQIPSAFLQPGRAVTEMPDGLYDKFQENIHRLFSESFNMRQMLTPWALGSRTAPYIDIVENDDGYTVYADVPGLGMDDIEVSCADSALIIEGKKERHTKRNGEQFIHRECCTAPFSRTVALPEDADPENASIVFKHNVLIIDVPRGAAAKRSRVRKLKVSGGERSKIPASALHERKAS